MKNNQMKNNKNRKLRLLRAFLVIGGVLCVLAINFNRVISVQAAGGCATPSFAPAQNFGAGDFPGSVTTADFNADGKPDIAAANVDSDNVSILLGDGIGGFAPATNFGTSRRPASVTTGDFNTDGKLDLATANQNSNNVSILLGDGIGGFSAPTYFGAGSNPVSVTTADFNADGYLDLATANIDSDNVSVLLGNGAGGFSAAMNFGAGDFPVSVTTADFNADGYLDLATANVFSSNVSVLLGNGAGGFSAAMNFGAGAQPSSVTTADFNSDGKLDIAATNQLSNNITVLLGNGQGGFAAGTNFGAGNGPDSVTTGDFNADGKFDLATANMISDDVSVLLGNGAGGFSAPTSFGAGDYPASVTTADFNADGSLDLATANGSSDTVSVLLNNCPANTNTAPVAVDDSYSTNEDTMLNIAAPGVIGNDTDNENDSLTAALVSDPSNAAAFSFNPDGSFSYTPAANFNGADSFTYKVSDGSLESNTATVQITVTAVNDPPTIAATTISRQKGITGTASVIATVGDTEDAAGSLTVTVTSVPTGISVTNITNSNGTITANITAACNAPTGSNTVGLKVTDSGGAMATANLIVDGTIDSDTDADGQGDVCDTDDDNDGVADAQDAFPLDPNESVDTDGDGIGNNADTDDDNDGFSDTTETAAGSNPLNPNSTPEVCDGIDNDLNDGVDEGFVNTDGDTMANCVDPDDDNDGVLDAADNCPLTFNPDQADFDLDGIGDTCDPQTGPPRNKDQCKNGGWMRFDFPRRFNNQGDCIQFVNTGR